VIRYRIRLAQAEEISALPDIERAAAVRFTPYGLVEQLVTSLTPIEVLRAGLDANRLWVAADESDRPIGFALVGVVGDNAHLDELDVQPAYGQRGIGTALVKTVGEWAKAAGYRAITLTT
jgi:GNAT superfamily N-acetyltransferase